MQKFKKVNKPSSAVELLGKGCSSGCEGGNCNNLGDKARYTKGGKK